MMDSDSQILCFGEILWDVLPNKKVPGGAPMNVALHLKKLGRNVKFFSRIGADDLGEQLKEYLNSVPFNDYHFQVDREHGTSIAEVDMTDPGDPKYRFPDCAWDHIEMDDNLVSILSTSDIIVYGSLVARSRDSYETLSKVIENDLKYRVFDINLREPHYSRELIEKLLHAADLVKMNDHELKMLAQWFYSPDEGEERLLRKIMDDFECYMIAVTKGDQGASLMHTGSYHTHPGYQVEVADTIGAGDAFLASLLHGVLKENDPQDILSVSCATGAFVAGKTGANPDYSLDEVYKMLGKR